MAYAGGSQAKEARYRMSIAAAIGMKAQMIGGGSLAHALNSQIVVSCNGTHGAACSILLPYNMKFVLSAVPERLGRIAELMGEKIDNLTTSQAAKRAIEAVRKLSKDLGVPQTLKEMGVNEADLDRFADNLIERLERLSYLGFRRIRRDDVIQIYKSAL
jgi:alcohol dehydrogenase class IV